MLKIGVIGFGSMGKNHARVCSEFGAFQLTDVSDIDPSVVRTIADRFHTKPFYEDEEMIKEIDAAIIAIPTVTYHKIDMDLLNPGKQVLVEKPFCGSVQKAEELAKKQKKEGLINENMFCVQT